MWLLVTKNSVLQIDQGNLVLRKTWAVNMKNSKNQTVPLPLNLPHSLDLANIFQSLCSNDRIDFHLFTCKLQPPDLNCVAFQVSLLHCFTVREGMESRHHWIHLDVACRHLPLRVVHTSPWHSMTNLLIISQHSMTSNYTTVNRSSDTTCRHVLFVEAPIVDVLVQTLNWKSLPENSVSSPRTPRLAILGPPPPFFKVSGFHPPEILVNFGPILHFSSC